MQKVLVAEIGSEMTVVNAFGDLDAENPLLLGQGISRTTLRDGDVGIGLKFAVTALEKNIGPVSSLGKTPFYATSSLSSQDAVQEVDGQYFPGSLGIQEIWHFVQDRILPTPGAITQAAQLIYEEVGDVLVLAVEGASTAVYSITSRTDKHQKSNLKLEPIAYQTVEEDLGVYSNGLTLVKLIGENSFKERHGQGWEKLLKYRPETPEEVALSAELTAAAITTALERHSGRLNNLVSGKVASLEGRGLAGIRWIVGTGVALTQLPNGLEIMKQSIMKKTDTMFPQEGIAVLLDRDCIMASMGVITTTFRLGAWQLLRESLGVEN
ncbi:glutamate mutase L [Desulfosporosinus fructosivorans]